MLFQVAELGFYHDWQFADENFGEHGLFHAVEDRDDLQEMGAAYVRFLRRASDGKIALCAPSASMISASQS